MGFSLLDFLITLIVLTIILLAAANQFATYQKPVVQPVSQEQAQPTESQPPPEEQQASSAGPQPAPAEQPAPSESPPAPEGQAPSGEPQAAAPE